MFPGKKSPYFTDKMKEKLLNQPIFEKGQTNNDMLRMFMELKGKLPNKIIRRGLFKNLHFDENCCFLSHETDRVTQRDKVRFLFFFR